jgi:hypothetical protein
MNQGLKLALAAVILSLGMVLSASLLSKFFVKIRHEQAITVKGFAEQDLTSDVGKFSCECSVRGATLQESYVKLQASRAAVLAYLRKMGFKDDEIVPGTIDSRKIAQRDAQGKETNEIEYYDITQRIAVMSANVQLIREVATGITELIKEGIDINAFAPEFYISDLKDDKLKLLAEATRDGYRRAVELAGNSHGRVGALISAQQGVFQITAKNSTDTSDYGTYDTATIRKTARIVVTLQYAIEAGGK